MSVTIETTVTREIGFKSVTITYDASRDPKNRPPQIATWPISGNGITAYSVGAAVDILAERHGLADDLVAKSKLRRELGGMVRMHLAGLYV